jgi:hypothetical protein
VAITAVAMGILLVVVEMMGEDFRQKVKRASFA